MEHRICVIGIVVTSRENVQKLNAVLSEFSEIIVGRKGVPYRERNLSVISLIVDGSTDEVGDLTGRVCRVQS